MAFFLPGKFVSVRTATRRLLAQRAVTSRGEDETWRIPDHLQQTGGGLTAGRLDMGAGPAEWKRQEITGAQPHVPEEQQSECGSSKEEVSRSE